MAAPSMDNLGAFRTQARELKRVGIRAPRDFARFVQIASQSDIVRAVLAGEVEVGFVRDGVLERMIARGEVPADAFKVIHERRDFVHPFRVSTELYPEWPVFALPHVSEKAVRHVAAALYALEPDHPAARAARIFGYTVASDYSSIEALTRELRLPPYDHIPDFGWWDVWERYQYVGVGFLLALGTSLVLVMMLAFKNQRLRLQQEQLELAASVFRNAGEGILITDDRGVILDVNPAFCAITGYNADEAIGKKTNLLKSGRHDAAFYARMWQQLLTTGRWRGEIWNRRKDGQIFPELMSIDAVRDASGRIRQFVAIFTDISEAKAFEERLRRAAYYDQLTGLPNRHYLSEFLESLLELDETQKQKFALLLLDLDGFKEINDRYGRDAGDAMLIQLTARLQLVVPKQGFLARIAGDAFAVVVPGVCDHSQAERVAHQLIASIAQPVSWQDHGLSVTTSVGITLYPQKEPIIAEHLLRQANQALYYAKVAGKNRAEFFDSNSERNERERQQALARIAEGIARREFVLFYQPKVELDTGRIVGVEALIRWRHPERGLLPPGQFLPLIEGEPVERALGHWVIAEALAQAEAWRRSGRHWPVAVNIVMQQLLADDFLDEVAGMLQGYPEVANEGLLSFEVLETSVFTDLPSVAQQIEALQALGIAMALDDFGTGYASLAYLKALPVRTLKIDRSFVMDMTEDPEDLAIVEGIVGLATAFRRDVVAEGVETVAQGELLLRLGCRIGQGFGIAKPMPPEELERWAQSWRVPQAWRLARPVPREAFALVAAEVEHHAWIAKLRRRLLDGNIIATPPLDEHACRFGQWFFETFADDLQEPQVAAVRDHHSKVHELANALIAKSLEPEASVDPAEFTAIETASSDFVAAIEALIESRFGA